MASRRGLPMPFQVRPAGAAAPPLSETFASLLLPGLLALTALGVGVLAGINPKLAIAAVLGLSFAVVVIANITAGMCLFAFISFLDVLRSSGLGFTKLAGFLLVISWLAMLATRGDTKNDFISVHPVITYLLALFVAWAGLTMLWAEEPSNALNATFRYLQNGLLFLIVFTAIRERRHALWLAGAFVGGASIAAMASLAQPPDVTQYDVVRATGTIGDPNELAAVLVAGMVFAGALTLMLDRSPSLRLAAGGAAMLCAGGVFVTLSRGGIIAMGFALLTSVVIGGRWRSKALTLMVLAAFGAILYFLVLAPPGAVDRVTTAGGGTGRTDLWKVGSRMVEAHPIRGVGAGNFEVSSIHYLLKPGAIKRDDFFITTPKVAHNTYLQELAEGGIVAFSLFISIIVFSFTCALRAARCFMRMGDERMELLARALIVALAGIMAASFFISNEFSKQLWLLLGFGPALLAISHRRSEISKVSTPVVSL
jgi:O-antigen ligase